MPERSWGGGSSSSSSSTSSSSSSSGSSWSSNRRYDNDNNSGPTDPIWSWISLGILAVIVVVWLISNAAQHAKEQSTNAAATATTHAITVSDLAMMHAAIDSSLSRWRELGKTTPTHVTAASLDFPRDSNTAEVVYGYCDDAKQHFYLYVLNERPPQSAFFADTEGYAYIKDMTPSSCHPAEWQIQDYVYVTEESGWYFAIMETKITPYPTYSFYTLTPTPTRLGF